ncbi:neutral alpha-glucosidase AB [Leptinotarsa decemlineata]|uniref:neutral alpha-glucosidase AB n=1 Tax=Leptinotarsa decemlineata TaxID=7539 RepID=UPI003D30A74D
MALRRILITASSLYFCLAVDKNNFKTCDQSSFCRRLRNVKPDNSKYELDLSSLQVTDDSIEAKLVNTEVGAQFKFSLTAINGNIFRVQVDEVNPLYTRYRPQFALNGEVQLAKLQILDRNKDSVTAQYADNKAVISARPFKIDFFKKDSLVSVVNGRGLFTFEHYRKKPAEGEAEQAPEDPGAWEENFKSHHDSKPKGPSAVGLDVTFPGALRAYGLPEHGDRLPLRTTGPGGVDPYRLYNLDVFEYELDSTMAIYGSVPVVHAHSPKHTVGVFWHNAAETWVDINNSKDGNVMSSLVNLVSGSKSESSVEAHFMSESGVVDLFVLMGPSPRDTVRQYASLTGVAPLPQYFTLAYHQCRWNYNDEDDVTSVVENFDAHDMPVDIMWLDIEYTDGKKYFTWDKIKFPHPDVMIGNLTSTGRKLVVIIDPHIKRESGYFLHEDALANDYYVKTKEGNVYEGWCWPGSSSYLDFYDPRTFDYYKGLYALDKFVGTTNDVNIWNDMNEPSVFNGPEITMPKDCLHYGGWEHRDIHNEYPLAQSTATFQGLLERSPNRRPFILTRGHFAGTQRSAAIWTGDNAAEWSHLAISYPMCLSEALGGISFCGADVGGFFNNPDVELLQRWYQAAIWLPFFRAHAHIDTRRREPYLFNEDVRNRIRAALRLRYAHLPLWYTLFWEHETTGDPVIRPLFYSYPSDENVVDIDSELLVGDSVLAKAISEAGASTASVYLPGGSDEYWYDVEDFKLYRGTGNFNIPVTLDKMVAFYRGGSIIPRKDRPRRASSLMHEDPYTLYVALDSKGSASGRLYVDDRESYGYKNGKYLYLHLRFENGQFSSSPIDKTDYPTKEWVERVVILGAPKGTVGANLSSRSMGTVRLETSYSDDGRALVVRKPGVSIREAFTIKLN